MCSVVSVRRVPDLHHCPLTSGREPFSETLTSLASVMPRLRIPSKSFVIWALARSSIEGRKAKVDRINRIL